MTFIYCKDLKFPPVSCQKLSQLLKVKLCTLHVPEKCDFPLLVSCVFFQESCTFEVTKPRGSGVKIVKLQTGCGADAKYSVRSFGMIWIRISDPRSLGSWYIKGTDESTLVTDSSVPLMHHDPSDLGSLILI